MGKQKGSILFPHSVLEMIIFLEMVPFPVVKLLKCLRQLLFKVQRLSANMTHSNEQGTEPSECNDAKDSCSCDLSGGCKCKSLVEGKKCASCVPGTFGLTLENPEGCTKCFCFGRTSQCHQGNYVWIQLSSSDTRRNLIITRGNTRLEVSQGILIVPNDNGDSVIGVERLFTTPLYWSLPDVFLGDKVLSYNGFLRFSTSSNGDTPNSILTDPLVQIQSHDGIIGMTFQI